MPSVDTVIIGGMSLWHTLLDLLFPPRCIICRRPGTWLCVECTPHLPYITGPVCQHCGEPLSHGTVCRRCRQTPLRLEGIRSVLLYEGPVRDAVHRLKYRGGRTLAPPLGALMATAWQQQPPEVDVIVPVPLHPRRLRQRGYNQAALLAREIGWRTGLAVNEEALCRTRATPPQMRLNAAARRQNIAGAFRCPDGSRLPPRVLLVDDVCTTGATLEACADALRASGASLVWALTLARTRHPPLR
jgi:ComF family protein